MTDASPPPYSTSRPASTKGHRPQRPRLDGHNEAQYWDPASSGPSQDLPPIYSVQNDHQDNADSESGQLLDATFTSQSIRRGFIRKVFLILFVQLLITFGGMAVFVYCEPLREYALSHEWMYIAAIFSTIVIIIVLACCGDIRRKYPVNYICLVLFTLAWTWVLGTLAATFTAKEIWMAVGIVCVITLAMCILAIQTKIKFTWMAGGIIILSLSLLGFGILCLIVQDRYAYLACAAVGALLFSLWLLFDVQMVVGGDNTLEIDPEEYVFAALNIYIDIINILLRILLILRFAGGK